MTWFTTFVSLSLTGTNSNLVLCVTSQPYPAFAGSATVVASAAVANVAITFFIVVLLWTLYNIQISPTLRL
ncbi:hypothetical protein BOW86_gp054 [Synechococcus phage S-CAM7]|uniref:Uncharacterized protein n=1 Tax=Synechococcus phage S-CAM7 TaxID=1883368 RepID=A0A1D8KTF9_9CAUD|nr:hypothetical protein BOW86_gp054 [Synechococcus phage S-CAM7]AOV61978.1 hypothetical protein C490910_054 [Synechococcus phage S-CAM7]